MSENTDSRIKSTEPYNEREIAFKEREIALKEKELEAKINQEKRSLWFTSPLSIGVITAVLGLIGTGIASLLQENASLNLERLKFEYSLIQKALEAPNQDEAAKELLFLINTGVIVSLDGEKLRKIAEKPSLIPIFVPFSTSARDIFFEGYVSNFGKLTDETKTALTQIFSFLEQDKAMQNLCHVAYILATIKYETAGSFIPLAEFGDVSSFNKYDPGTSIGKRLGNIERGDGFRFRGRGFIQITGRYNYKKLNDLLGLAGTDDDIVENPDKVLAPSIAYRILAHGMTQGTFTSKKLTDYVNHDKCDYKHARRIVSGGLVDAEEIADDAKAFEAILRKSLAKN